MPPTATQNRRRRDLRRAQQRQNLFDALERLLVEQPFPEITVPQILEAAGISRSTFYLYFDDKADLLLATADSIFAQADEVAGEWWRGPADTSRADLEQALARVFALYREHRDVLRGLSDAAGYEPAVHERLARMHEGYIDGLAAHIRAGQTAGLIRASHPPRTTAAWIIWMLERGQYQMIATAARDELAEQVRALAGLVWFALYETPTERSVHPSG